MSEIRFNRWSHQSGTGGIYQDSSGNIGIGTSTPTSVLDIQGGSIKIGNDLLTSSGVSTFTSGLNVTGGSVGIGTDNPSAKLQVHGDASVGYFTFRGGNVAGGFGSFINNSGTTIGYIGNGAGGAVSAGDVNDIALRAESDLLFASGGNSERLRITSSGNVGIATTDPQGTLSVGGNISLDVALGTIPSRGGITRHTNEYTYFVGKSDGAGAILNNGDGTATVRAENPGGSAGFISFETGSGSETVRITANQRVGIETTNPQAKLHINDSGSTISPIQIDAEYPSIGPSLYLNFLRSRTLDPRIEFTRASNATYIDSSGSLKVAYTDEPRFDHDPTTFKSLGLLIEPSKTNQAYGAPGAASAAVYTAQYNTLTNKADAYRAGKNAPTSAQSHLSWAVTGSANQTSFYISVFVKTINTNAFFMQIVANPVTDNLYIYYDVGTGFTSSTDFSSSGNLTVTPRIEDYKDGWKRLSARVEGWSQTAFNGSARIGFANPSGYAQQYTNTDHEFLAYGMQVEGGNVLTSYIPTDSATGSVTRVDEYASITGDAFFDFYNQAESTVVCNFTQNTLGYGSNGGADGNERAYRFTNTTGSDSRIDYVTYNAYHPYIAADGSQVSNLTSFNNLYGGLENRTAVRVKNGDMASALNGTIEASSSDTGWPPTNTSRLQELYIGSYQNSGHLNGHIREFIYYPTGLTNAQLQLLTS